MGQDRIGYGKIEVDNQIGSDLISSHLIGSDRIGADMMASPMAFDRQVW